GRKRVRLLGAHAGRIQMVSGQARARRRPDGWRVWCEFGDPGPARDELDRVGGLAADISSAWRVVLCDGDDWRLAAEESARWLSAGRMESAVGSGAPTAGVFAERNAQNATVLLPLVRVLSRHNGWPYDH